jgi:hypothetical protein
MLVARRDLVLSGLNVQHGCAGNVPFIKMALRDSAYSLSFSFAAEEVLGSKRAVVAVHSVGPAGFSNY